jgi:diguanylate cyclase (GGDEF)-like protein
LARKYLISLAVCTLLSLLAAFAARAQTDAEPSPSLRYSLGSSAPDVVLADILSGIEQVPFSPIVSNGVALDEKSASKHWMRLLIEPSQSKQPRVLSFERKNIRYIRLYQSEKDGKKIIVTPLMSSEAPHAEFATGRWPTRIEYTLPLGYENGGMVYAELKSSGYMHFHPRLSEPGANSLTQGMVGDSFFTYLYVALIVIALLALFRQLSHPESQAILVCLNAAIALAAFIAYNTHAALLINANFLIEPRQAYALLILGVAPFFAATNHYAGLSTRWEQAAKWLNWAALVMIVLAAVTWFWRDLALSTIQAMTLFIWTVSLLCAICAYVFDSRHSKWTGLILAIGLMAGLWAPYFVYHFILPDTRLNLYGFQIFFTLLLANYLFQPWLRALLKARGMRRRGGGVPAVAVELSSEEKIAQARDQLMQGLTSALENATEADIAWVAYRRLLEGLKPVLNQLSSAVIARNDHSEDFLIVEPKTEEERYEALINHRGNLLKNLSRMTAPQQVRLDFDGPEGPQQEVNVAIIPLPIAKPGWGALIVERHADSLYSEKEMDLCSEFAALATTAGDEAAEAMANRYARETDAETGALNRVKLDEILKKTLDASVLHHKPFSLLRVSLDRFNEQTHQQPEMRAELLQSFVAMMRDEIDYGAYLGRFYKEEFVVLMPGKNIGQARDQAQRLCNAASRIAVTSRKDIKFTISIGVSHLQPGERSSHFMLERVTAAMAKAIQYGGNQIQAISSATL